MQYNILSNVYFVTAQTSSCSKICFLFKCSIFAVFKGVCVWLCELWLVEYVAYNWLKLA